jgi:hypothetical protein
MKAVAIKINGTIAMQNDKYGEVDMEPETVTYLRNKFINWLEEQGMEFGGEFGGIDENGEIIWDY